MFEPGTYNSNSYRRNEACVDVHLPPPEGPFDVLRFAIMPPGSDERVTVTVRFAGPAEVGPEAYCTEDQESETA